MAQSFVKNMTSRVSGLLPATITKWFSSPKSSANGSAPAADATDSSTEDEAPESPASQPPAKRMRYSPGAVYGNTDANCVTNNIETIEPSTSFTVQSPPGRTTFRRETNYVSTPIRSPDDTIDRTDKDSTATFQQHTVTTIGPSVAKKRKSLFGNQSQELSDASKKAYVKTSNNTVKDPKQPSFKPTLLGSPFYAGRTTYGGAASSYINQPNITHRQNTTVRESPTTSDNNISHSARRVMELLESYSSPLTEAKRIPHYTRPTKHDLMKRISESSVSSSINKINSFKTQELHVSSIASILRLKQRSRLNDTTNAARQLIASHSSTSPDYRPYPSASKSDQKETDGSNKLTTKVKSRLTRPARGDTNALDTETLPPVDLPNAILQIDPSNLPDFGSPLATKTTLSQKPSLTATYSSSIFEKKSTPAVEIKSIETVPSSSIYNFANPVRITSESPKTTTTPPKFTFGSPERKIDEQLTSENKSSEPLKPVAAAAKENKAETAPANWSCPDCWVSNKHDADKCVCCGYKHVAKPSSKPKCTLCKLADSQANSDKCVNCDKVQVNNISKPLKADTSKWKCEDCWVSNDEAADKCACCGAKNPKGASQVVPVKPAEPSSGMCPKCFAVTTNGKCGKCTQVSSTPDKNFKTVLKAQSNKWECEHCLVRNDSDKTRCVCCEADRSGKPKEPENKQFNFGTINTTFKFGIDPKVQEANLAKAAEKPAETKDKIEESETNNNVLAKAPTFSFGIPAKKSEDQPDASKEKTDETPKATFTFGLPKQNSVAPTPAPMFGIPSKVNDTPKEKEKDEAETKTQEVKAVEEAPKQPVVMFGATSTPAVTSAAPSQPILSTSFTLEKKEAPSNPLSLPTTSVSAPAPTLSFAAPKPATGGLFGAIATTAAPASVNFAPITTPATTATMFQKTDTAPKPLSMFQKSDPATTATVSLFQKSEAPATAAAPPSAATAPMFSFGSTQSAQPQTDKPKFSFTFGGNKTDNVFKPPTFGGTDPNNAMNKFILGSATDNPMGASNPLASGNSLAGNSLAGNSLTGNNLTGNSLTGNSLTGNTMTSNSIASNPLSGNGMQAAAPAATGMFGSVPKENMWSPPNSSTPNPFVANASTNNAPKPFAFGSSTPFNAAAAPAFGGVNTQTSTTPAFGAAKMTFGGASQPPAFGAASPPAPAFGSNVQSTPSIFGMNNQNNQPSMFSTPAQNSTGMFGSPQQPAAGSMPPPSVGMFGRPSVGAAPTFGTPNSSIPNFEAPSLTPAQAPAFNFGSTPTSNIFGFGQQQPQQPGGLGGGQTGVYSFGVAPGAQAPVQFNMGSAPNAAGRRVRKAVRRSSQR
ncbi:uncharacterized protein isoform X2 [Choristoneura fumiferana]|uniref:uncharacterized protein isoform X2 n=1 Tax=Choristoneura fumiferana TaxID=7141 RepID=UPI003D15BEEB